jgi:hypothetical protein
VQDLIVRRDVERTVYVIAIPLAFVWPNAAYGCYIFVAVMWLPPDRRIEKRAARP